MTFLQTKQNKGFVILFAVTLASILIAIALGISNIALDEVNFSTSVKDSDNAFYAADTGAECALYNDKSASNVFVSSGWPSTITCGNSSLPLFESGSLISTPPSLTWSFDIPSMEGSTQCAQVSLQRDFSNPSFPATKLDSEGFNVGDSSCNSTSNDRTEREIQLDYSVATIASTDGVCAATHSPSPCLAGTPTTIVDNGTNWTWSCVGYSGGSTASCSENKTAIFGETGATTTTDGSYTVDTFAGGGSFTVTGGSASVDYLIVGGGASGGTSGAGSGGAGGGGGGGVLSGSTTLAPGTYTITVGNGGVAVATGNSQGNNGANSTFNSMTALGGGGGGAAITGASPNGLSGGSGGGAGYNGYCFATVGPGTAGQGNSGGQNGSNNDSCGGSGLMGAGGGGGGGAGGAGSAPDNSPLHDGGLGGAGMTSSITGSALTYGVGGRGASGSDTTGAGGAVSTGDGGGGVYNGGRMPGGAGGSGVVIIRYLTP